MLRSSHNLEVLPWQRLVKWSKIPGSSMGPRIKENRREAGGIEIRKRLQETACKRKRRYGEGSKKGQRLVWPPEFIFLFDERDDDVVMSLAVDVYLHQRFFLELPE